MNETARECADWIMEQLGPEEIFGGRRGSGERTPDDAVAKAIAEARADWESGE